MKFRPHEYQLLAINKIKTDKSCGLFLDMGLGKTVITLSAISDLLALEEIHKVLVIAPLQTAKNTWGSEIHKWDHLKDLTYSLVLGSESARRKALEADVDIYIINRENVQWLCDNSRTWDFDMVVLDELSSFKNPSAKRFKALRKVMPYVNKVVGLTGTPASNGYLDLWSEIYLLDRGERLGRTVGMYRQTYFHPGRRNGYIVYDWKLNTGAKEIIDRKLEDLCISMKAVDYLDMPDKVVTDITVEMNEHERKIYDKFGRDHILPDKKIIGINAATVQGKMLQMANGFAYNEDKTAIPIHEHKIEALKELIEAAQAKSVLVYYSYIADKEKILQAVPEACELKGDDVVSEWNAGHIKVLLAHPASAGHGLNLQEGGNILIWYGLPWSLELYEQANARLFRQGQKNTVYIYHILTKDTHDQDVLAALNRKHVTQEALLKALKARIKEWEED